MYFRKRLKRCDVSYHVLQTWKDNIMPFKKDFEKVLPIIDKLMEVILSEVCSLPYNYNNL